ncbi:MAG: hypothetical protein H7281_02925 [Bacteriovorax sp.]|nr:hypothetical protein [Bacteriovorax sp.]
MKTALLLSLLATLITSKVQASVVKGFDAEKSCVLYRVLPAPTDSKVKVKLKTGEVIVYDKDAYGLSFQDMEVNFDNREVLIQPTINIVLGFNRPLIQGKAIIEAENPDFNFLINQLNRKLYVFEKVCIADGKIIYAKMFEDKPESTK